MFSKTDEPFENKNRRYSCVNSLAMTKIKAQKTITISARLVCALVVFSFSFFVFRSNAQIKSDDLQRLRLMQDSLKVLSDSVVTAKNPATRLQSSQAFIRTLVRALKVEGSYNFPFDSLKRIVILNAPDKKFRIFNWGTMLADGTYRYYGTVQMNDKKKLSMFPLVDFSDRIVNVDTATSHERWYGALYYKIVQKKKYYYLFGWDGNDAESNKKLIDVMWFDSKGKPRFGAPHFVVSAGGRKRTVKRFIMEYREEASVTLNYDPDSKMIVFDHLVPPSDNAAGMYAFYIPDGSYDAFEFKSGKWQHRDNIWRTTQDTPFPKPLDFEKETLSKPRSNNKKKSPK